MIHSGEKLWHSVGFPTHCMSFRSLCFAVTHTDVLQSDSKFNLLKHTDENSCRILSAKHSANQVHLRLQRPPVEVMDARFSCCTARGQVSSSVESRRSSAPPQACPICYSTLSKNKKHLNAGPIAIFLSLSLSFHWSFSSPGNDWFIACVCVCEGSFMCSCVCECIWTSVCVACN